MPAIDLPITFAGLLVGLIIGLTGMGGGALMTPLLVLGFGVQPLAAVSSDLVAAVLMKPVGGVVHARRGTVNRQLVLWLVLGSVPSAFVGVLLLRQLGDSAEVQAIVRVALGLALLVAASAIVGKEVLLAPRAQAADSLSGSLTPVKKLPTLMVGILGGLVVGMTSVGSGSLMMLMLVLLYPRLRLRELVGTDLVQAVPLVLSAACGHLLFGEFELGLTLSVALGGIPGVYLGARLSARASDHIIRPVLVAVLLASGLKLLGCPALLGVSVSAAAGVLVMRILRRPAEEEPRPAPALLDAE